MEHGDLVGADCLDHRCDGVLGRAVIVRLRDSSRQLVLVGRNRLDVRLDVADQDKADAMLDILRVGVSAGGAVPKAVLAINDEGHIVSGQTEAPEGYVAAPTMGRFGGCKGCAFFIPEGDCSCERLTGEFPRCYPDLRSDGEPCIFIKKGTP